MDDVVINKVQSLQRCVLRAREEYALAEAFSADYSRQDAAVLNIIRACEQAIDLANHIVRVRKLGVPVQSRESFTRLARAGLISVDLSQKLQGMVGFRNVAVHQYDKLNLEVVTAVLEHGLGDLVAFSKLALSLEPPWP